MYGLILENISQHTCREYGREAWDEIRRLADIKEPTFSIHKIYPDNYVPRITVKAVQVLKITEREYLYNVGVSFVSFVGVYGYDKVLSVLGRQFRDFLNGLDNLHEYLRFSYPKLKPPSYYCTDETDQGMKLHYRSKRSFLLWYTVGQIEEVGRHFYQTAVETEVLNESYDNEEYYFVLQLMFDNKAFVTDYQQLSLSRAQIQTESTQLSLMPLKARSLFEIFPFCLVFDSEMIIKAVGGCLQLVLPNITGLPLPRVFMLSKPRVGYNWHSISGHLNSTFEMASIQPLKRDTSRSSLDKKLDTMLNEDNLISDSTDGESHKFLLKLKGQMLYMEEWKCMVFLAAPNIEDVEAMTRTGLYLNDLSLHDFSRDMVLAGQQQTAELKLALDQELHKSKQLEDSMIKLDQEMKRTDELLYQMINRLRKGLNPIDTCQYFPCVTILFSDIVNFTVICSRITPMQVVNMLNAMYSLFDELTERHNVYKVETIGDAYMICSGGGIILDGQDNTNHAQKVCEQALDMIRVVYTLKDPSSGNNLNIRIVVGGIVGQKMPRYCLFGDTVNTASRIESSSEAQMVQISEMTKAMLDPNEWDVYERGTIQLKGKGYMKTYWLCGRKGQASEADTNDHEMFFKKVNKIESMDSERNRVDGYITTSKVKITNLSANKTVDSSLPLVSVKYKNRFNRLMQMHLNDKQINDEINSDNQKSNIKSVEKISSLKEYESHRQVRSQRQNTVYDSERVNTNKILINNSLTSTENYTSTDSIDNNVVDGGQGCFTCNSKSNRSQTSCNLS